VATKSNAIPCPIGVEYQQGLFSQSVLPFNGSDCKIANETAGSKVFVCGSANNNQFDLQGKILPSSMQFPYTFDVGELSNNTEGQFGLVTLRLKRLPLSHSVITTGYRGEISTLLVSPGISGAELDGFGYYGLVDSKRGLSDPGQSQHEPPHAIEELNSDELAQWGKTLIDAADELCTPVDRPTPPFSCTRTKALPIDTTIVISSAVANGNACISALITAAVVLLARCKSQGHTVEGGGGVGTDPLLLDDSLQSLRIRPKTDANLNAPSASDLKSRLPWATAPH
jgi:hypothetical protein